MYEQPAWNQFAFVGQLQPAWRCERGAGHSIARPARRGAADELDPTAGRDWITSACLRDIVCHPRGCNQYAGIELSISVT